MTRYHPISFAAAALVLAALACGSQPGTAMPTTPPGAAMPTIPPGATPSPQAAIDPTGGGPAPRGQRSLGIDVNETAQVDYGTAFPLAQAMGLDFVSLSVFWDELETEPGVFQPDPNWLAIANEVYGAQGVAVALVVAPVDTNVLRVPQDLRGAPFDDPALTARYLAALDYALSQLPDVRLVSISVGNEVDSYLSAHPDQWPAYAGFYAEAVGHLHQRAPGVPVGVKATYAGLTGDQAAALQRLNEPSDAILATYYPLEADFGARPPGVIHQDLQALLGLYPDRPVYLLEVGYPSSPLLSSSEAQQAQFVRQVFAAWDRHADRVPLVNFTWMHDISQVSLDTYAGYYGSDHPRFLAFLGSLGLRTHDGVDKTGFEALREGAEARGW